MAEHATPRRIYAGCLALTNSPKPPGNWNGKVVRVERALPLGTKQIELDGSIVTIDSDPVVSWIVRTLGPQFCDERGPMGFQAVYRDSSLIPLGDESEAAGHDKLCKRRGKGKQARVAAKLAL